VSPSRKRCDCRERERERERGERGERRRGGEEEQKLFLWYVLVFDCSAHIDNERIPVEKSRIYDGQAARNAE